MRIKLHPTGQELEVDPNKSLLQICMDNKVEIKSICKGVPSCAECRVKILAGEHNLIPPNKAELNLIGTSYFIDGRRLACQVRAFGDISVDISEHLEKDENNTKKLRGYRPQPGRQTHSTAVQGTLVLQESAAPAGGRQEGGRHEGGGRGENRKEQAPREARATQEGGRQEAGKPQQGQQQNAQKREGGGGNRNRNRNRNRRGGGGGGGGNQANQGGGSGGGQPPKA